MKNVLRVFAVFVLCLCFVLPAFAAEEEVRVLDGAELLSPEEEVRLNAELNAVRSRLNFDIAVITVESLGDFFSVQTYAEHLFESIGLGCGETGDGALFLLSMEERDWAISTHGYGRTALSSDVLSRIETRVVPILSVGDYAEAFQLFASLCENAVSRAKSGETSASQEGISTGMIVVCFVAGLVIALIVVGFWKRELKSVRFQAKADNYIKKDSMVLTDRQGTRPCRKIADFAR